MSVEPPFDPALSRQLRLLARTLLRDEASADDVVQEVWLASLTDPPSAYRDGAAWLRAVAKNIARKELRSRSRRTRRERAAARDEALDNAVVELEAAELRLQLTRAVAALEDPYRETIRARYFDELSIDEIAQRVGRPTGTVKTHLRRGIEQLRERLESEIGDRRVMGLTLIGGFDWAAEDVAATPRVAAPLAASGTVTWLGLPAGVVAATLVVLVSVVLVTLRSGDPEDRIGDTDTARAKQDPGVIERPRTVADGAFVAGGGRDSLPLRTAATEPDASTVAAAFNVEVIDLRGDPVAGASVWAWDGEHESHVGATGSNGVLRFVYASEHAVERVAIAPGGRSLAIVARAEGHADSWRHYPLVERVGSVRMRLQGDGFEARGIVIGAGGAPVRGATVHGAVAPVVNRGRNPEGDATEVLTKVCATAADGTFVLGGLRRVGQTLTAFAPGLGSVRVAVDGSDLAQGPIEMQLVPGATLLGRALDREGRPLAGVRIAVDESVHRILGATGAVSADDGTFELDGLPPGSTRIRLEGDGVEASIDVRFVSGDVVRRDVVLTLSDALELRLVDADGAPIQDARVSLMRSSQNWRRSALVDGTGRATVDRPPDSDEGGFLSDSVVIVAKSTDSRFPFALATLAIARLPDGPLELVCKTRAAFTGGLRGTLTDHEGRPVEGGKFVVRERETTLVARYLLDAKSGQFLADRLPQGTLELYAYTPGSPRHFLRTIDCDGTDHDLGEIRLPRPAVLHIDWCFSEQELRHRIDLVTYEGEGFGGRVSISEGVGPPAKRFDVLPGLFMARVNDADGKRIQVRFVRLTSGTERTLRLGPDAPELANLEVTWLAGASEAMALSVHRIGPRDMVLPFGLTEDQLKVLAAEGAEVAVLPARSQLDGTFQFEWPATEPAMLALTLTSGDGWVAYRYFRFGTRNGATPYQSYAFSR